MTLNDVLVFLAPDIEFHPGSKNKDAQVSFQKISASSAPEASSLVFISNPADALKVLSAGPAAVVLPQEYTEALPDLPFPVLSSKFPRRHMSVVMQKLKVKDQAHTYIHPSAVIHESARIGQGVHISAGVIIEAQAHVGDACQIGAQVVVEQGAQVGARSILRTGVIVGAYCILGESCDLDHHCSIGSEGFGFERDEKGVAYPIPHQGRVVLGDHVHLGAGTRVDRGTFGDTTIGSQSHFDNLCHIAHNCEVGESATVAGCFAMAGSSKIGSHFMCGGRVNISGHIEITDNVIIVPNSSVIKTVDVPGVYGGTPAIEKGIYFKNVQVGLKLYDFYKDFRKLKKKIMS